MRLHGQAAWAYHMPLPFRRTETVPDPHSITSLAALEALYDQPPAEASILKETDRIVPV